MAKSKDIIAIDELLPPTLVIIPLTGRPIFPGIFTPLMVNGPDDVKAVEEAYAGDGFIGLSMLKDGGDENDVRHLYNVGSVARIIKKINLPDGGVNIFISTLKRFKIKKILNKGRLIRAAIEYLDDKGENTNEVKALVRAIIGEMRVLSENNPLFSEEMRLNMINIDHPGKIADFVASILNISKENQQKILETLHIQKRMEQVFVHIKKEQELLQIQKKIQNDLHTRIEQNQREYFLREELKTIKEELGLSSDPKLEDEQRFRNLIDSFQFTGEVKEAVEAEFEKFTLLEPHTSEYTVSRNYLETVLALPWNNPDQEHYDLSQAQKILDSDHYGLEDVKKRIIEYLAVRLLKGDSKGSIILLVGPPGVGKTSVGKSVARAMNKPFFRFSVGGMRDEAEIKGHRRTYIGAMPGKILQGLKIVKTKAPVFMLDEVDKMGQSYHGDPSSALLEVLDPEQNVAFRDHYLDLPFDLSHIVFILTANVTDSIPRALLDRAEVIRLPGYIGAEKYEIGRKYLVPKSLEKHGIKRKQVRYSKSMLMFIANSYAREAGVRNFEKNLDKLHRKIATDLVMEKIKPNDVFAPTNAEIEAILGKPIFNEDEIKQASVPGTAVGLAWTSMGGDTLLIETIATEGKPSFEITGRMGAVMKESVSIALSWTRHFALKHNIVPVQWFQRHIIHIHIPEGATPKDGPSAGITMTTAFISLLIGKTVRPHLAMTGELSLTGQVLAIGGLKEKTMAARRNNIKTMIIPYANIRDLNEIPDYIKAGISFYPVKHIEEVLYLAFTAAPFKTVIMPRKEIQAIKTAGKTSVAKKTAKEKKSTAGKKPRKPISKRHQSV